MDIAEEYEQMKLQNYRDTARIAELEAENAAVVKDAIHLRIGMAARSTEIDNLKAENAKLRKCVKAADEMRGAMTDLGGCYDVRSNYVDNFDAARKELP